MVSRSNVGRWVEVAARAVAVPVLEWASAADRTGIVLGVGRDVCYLRFSDVVVALGLSDAPTLPNEVSLGTGIASPGYGFDSLVAGGDPAWLHPHGVDVGRLRVRWPRDAGWEPRLTPGAWSRDRVRMRGEAILVHLGFDAAPPLAGVADALARDGILLVCGDVGRCGVVSLFRALHRRNPDEAARAAEDMLGLGSGLTPEGDDLLAAAAAAVLAFGPSVGLGAVAGSRLVEALTPDAAGRTTALSATLLALARAGRTLGPVSRVLDLDAEAACAAAIERLTTFGHTTGRMYLAGVGATAIALAAG
jgi:hypothetical protein